jgi:hypothetical protein
MRNIRPRIGVFMKAVGLVAGIGALVLIGGCASSSLVVTDVPSVSLDHIHAVYVFPFKSLENNQEAEAIMTQAFTDQLKADGVFRVVEEPGLADASFQGTVGKWVHGGIDASGVRSTKISGTMAFLNTAKQQLWFAAAAQLDPARLVADGLFARPPQALAPYWAKAVLQKLPGYTLKEGPEAQYTRK